MTLAHLSVQPSEILRRARIRDLGLYGSIEEVDRRYLSRYLPAQEIYQGDGRPIEHADFIVINDDLADVTARQCAMDEEPGPRRTGKYRALKVLLWGGNRVMRWQLRHGLAPRAFALLETTGRTSGLPRYTCVGNGLDGDTFWLIAAHGRQADWVRNIVKDPRVRVLADRRWRPGTASLMPEDDTAQRSRTLPYQWDAAIGRAIGTTPLTVRIDLQ